MGLRCSLLLSTALCACQITGTLYEKRFEAECGATDSTRQCLCEDDRFGIAECFGAGQSGPCDCVGRPPGGGVVELAMGGLHSCAVLADRRVTCWGDGSEGQLANGTRLPSLQPTGTRVESNVEALALGGDDLAGHGCALLQDQRVECWGQNHLGQLGDGSREEALSPVTLELEHVVRLAAGTTHTCAVVEGGQALCWGDNDRLQLGYRTFNDAWSLTPMPVGGEVDATDVALGRYHSCAIDAVGDVWCWGDDEYGQLGDDDDQRRFEPARVEGLANVTQLALGAEHSCALDDDRQVHCWGRNHRGQLGDASVQLRRTPAPVDDLPETVAITAGWNHTCALDRGGSVRCWGDNADGQLGSGGGRGTASPEVVTDLENARAVVAALNSSCATLEDGSAMCWGDNRTGQLGDGTDNDRPFPVGVRWLDAPLGGGDAGTM